MLVVVPTLSQLLQHGYICTAKYMTWVSWTDCFPGVSWPNNFPSKVFGNTCNNESYISKKCATKYPLSFLEKKIKISWEYYDEMVFVKIHVS